MRTFTRKQKIVATTVVAAAVAVAGAGTAYAYWSATGSGSGSAAVGSGTNDLVITNDVPTGLVPGGNVSVVGHIKNNNAKTTERAGTVSALLSIDSLHAGCSAADFTLPNVQVNSNVAPGATVDFTGTLSMTNDALNSQDACKGATVQIAWSSS